MVASIIGQHMATLHELDTVYSYEDALNMSEILIVKNYNEWAAYDEAERKNK